MGKSSNKATNGHKSTTNNSKKYQKDTKTRATSGKTSAAYTQDSAYTEGVGKTHNDWRWYVENADMLKDVASLPFSNVLGLPINLMRDSTQGAIVGYVNNRSKYIPGVMAIELEPSLGCGKYATDAPTLAARQIYTYVRHYNSGSANYESPDMMMYILAYCSASAWIAAMKRAYGLMMGYYTKNRFYADTIVRAAGFNPNELRNNLAQFRAHINLSAARLNSLKIPGGMPLLERWRWLMSNVFMDADELKAQTYVPVFRRYLRYSSTTDEGGTELRMPETPNSASAKMQDYFNFTENLLNSLLSEEDVGIMAGDILKAYEGKVSTEETIPADYIVTPKYDDTVLEQFRNAYFVDNINTAFGATAIHTIKQDNGIIVENFSFPMDPKDWNFTQSKAGLILNLSSKAPSPEEVIVSTRLSPAVSVMVDDEALIRSCGTEIPLCMRIWWNTNDTLYISSVIDNADNVQFLTGLSCFNKHPTIYSIDQQGNFAGTLGNIENFTIVSDGVLESMHRNAVFAELRTTYTQNGW